MATGSVTFSAFLQNDGLGTGTVIHLALIDVPIPSHVVILLPTGDVRDGETLHEPTEISVMLRTAGALIWLCLID